MASYCSVTALFSSAMNSFDWEHFSVSFVLEKWEKCEQSDYGSNVFTSLGYVIHRPMFQAAELKMARICVAQKLHWLTNKLTALDVASTEISSRQTTMQQKRVKQKPTAVWMCSKLVCWSMMPGILAPNSSCRGENRKDKCEIFSLLSPLQSSSECVFGAPFVNSCVSRKTGTAVYKCGRNKNKNETPKWEHKH